jgi:uncharacterized protein GlcG (DUF336 family)
MERKIMEKLIESHPASHLHCDVTRAGQNSYRIVVAVLDSHGEVLASIDHYGSGDLASLKEQAYQRLEKEMEQLEMV